MRDQRHNKLIKKAIKGNKRAFEEIMTHHYKQIYRTAFLYVHNQEDALDVVQEATAVFPYMDNENHYSLCGARINEKKASGSFNGRRIAHIAKSR
ncbi:hypothetical protein ACQKJC_13785 [Priestia koreensis]|uniref:hypothetical protein n=1 Tax=Priestia koreensis TaxID=284581 RepID=UPI003D03552D